MGVHSSPKSATKHFRSILEERKRCTHKLNIWYDIIIEKPHLIAARNPDHYRLEMARCMLEYGEGAPLMGGKLVHEELIIERHAIYH